MEKNVFFRTLLKWGGGPTHTQIFGPFSRSAFFVNIKSLFFQKCLCIELLTVFRLLIYLPPLQDSDSSDFQILNFDVWKKDQVAQIEVKGGLGDSGNVQKKTFFFP